MYYFIAFIVGAVVGGIIVFFVTMNNLKRAQEAKAAAEIALTMATDELKKLRGR